MNRKKYFPSDDEEDIHLRNDTGYSQSRISEDAGNPRRTGKEDYDQQARFKDHDAGNSRLSEKMTPPQTRFRNRER